MLVVEVLPSSFSDLVLASVTNPGFSHMHVQKVHCSVETGVTLFLSGASCCRTSFVLELLLLSNFFRCRLR